MITEIKISNLYENSAGQPRKILDVNNGLVYFRGIDKDTAVYCLELSVFLQHYSPPREAPKELWINIYKNRSGEFLAYAKYTKKEAEDYRAAVGLEPEEFAVQFIRADLIKQKTS